VFSLYVVLSFAFPRESKIPSGVGPAVTYLIENALLLPGVFRISPMITAAWSLSFEAAFYLILPPLIAVLGLRSRSPRVRILVIGALSLVIAVFFYRWYRAAMFGAGIILAEWSRLRTERGEGRDWDTFGLVALVVAIPVAAVLFNRQLLPSVIPTFLRLRPLAYVLVLSVAFLPMCIAAFSGKGRLARFFTLRPLRLLGNMSYSYYLLHGVTLKGLFFILAMVLPHGYAPAMSWVLLPFAFALTCLTSGVLFTLVERPYSIAAPKQVMAY
jgi:exopolysaccharide production protein ExoZ